MSFHVTLFTKYRYTASGSVKKKKKGTEVNFLFLRFSRVHLYMGFKKERLRKKKKGKKWKRIFRYSAEFEKETEKNGRSNPNSKI